MKYLKYFGYLLMGLLILFVVLAFVMPTEQSITVEKTLKGKKNMLFNAINDMRAQEVWNPWKEQDELMTFTIGDQVVGKGASYSYTSEKMGNGTYTITESNPDLGISSKVVFEGRGEGTGRIDLSSDGDNTKASWTFDWTTGRFTNVFAPIMKWGFKKTLRNGLSNLENLVQERQNTGKYYGYEVQEEITPLRYFATKRAEVSQEKMQQFYASNLGILFNKIQEAEAKMDGQPCALIYNYKEREGKIDMASAIPLSDNIAIPGAIQEMMEAGNSVTVDYYGDHKGIGTAHDAIQTYMTDRELVHNWPVIEAYITDPSEEQDPAKWLTKITYPIGN